MEKLTMEGLAKKYPEVYTFFETHDLASMENGKYPINDTDYVSVQSYDTKAYAEKRYESHHRFIDIQYIIDGTEKIVVAPVDTLVPCTEFDEVKDIIFYGNETAGEDIILTKGEMVDLLPEDGHMPGVSVAEAVPVKKAVVKVLIR